MSEPSTMTLDDALTEVEARFIVTLPKQEIKQTERLFFHIEQAYWFYEDFFADKYNNLPHFKTLKMFTEIIIPHCPQLRHLTGKMSDLFDSFCSYKDSIPVCGVIMLNAVMSRLVLVRNWKGNSWSFPRGKINQDESPFDCAIRETYEETGFNPRQYCNQEHVLTFREKQGKTAKMFIAVGVPEQAEFAPQTRKEISKVEFHDIYNLPKSNWGVLPFMQMLYKWIEKNYVCQKKSKRDKKKKGEKSGEAAVFDKRNQSTFGDIAGGHDTWGVEDMFTANAKLTGKEYVYDGNPHNFGSVHPRYVNYNQIVPASTQVQSEQQIATSTITAAVKISDCDTSADVRDLKMSENEETALAAQRDIAKIKAILKYLLLPKVDLLAPKSIKFDLLLRSIADQRKMVRKVKEAGGVKISNSRMTKIVQSTIMSNREEQALKPEAEQQLTHHLDAALMVKEVDSYLNAHYDDIAW